MVMSLGGGLCTPPGHCHCYLSLCSENTHGKSTVVITVLHMTHVSCLLCTFDFSPRPMNFIITFNLVSSCFPLPHGCCPRLHLDVRYSSRVLSGMGCVVSKSISHIMTMINVLLMYQVSGISII